MVSGSGPAAVPLAAKLDYNSVKLVLKTHTFGGACSSVSLPYRGATLLLMLLTYSALLSPNTAPPRAGPHSSRHASLVRHGAVCRHQGAAGARWKVARVHGSSGPGACACST